LKTAPCEASEKIQSFLNDKTLDLEARKTFILGRRIHGDGKCDQSLFELILSTPGQAETIKAIRKKFLLAKNDEMLRVVSLTFDVP
jgi:hypothetical protein